MNYFAVGHLGAAGGIQVTASHNPAKYNGMKMSLREARPVSGDHGIPLLEEKVQRRRRGRPRLEPAGCAPPRFSTTTAATCCRSSSGRRGRGASRWSSTPPTAWGRSTGRSSRRWAIDLVPLYFELDGTFPNHEANPLKEENLRDLIAAVRRDGRRPRRLVRRRRRPRGVRRRARRAGRQRPRHRADRRRAAASASPGKAVVYDLRSSRAVAEYIAEQGGVPVRERVGHSFIKATLRRHDGVFGGELAGHYYFRDNYYADSSILAVVEMLNLLWRARRELLRPGRAAAPLRQEPGDQLRGRGQAGKDRRAGRALRRRRDRLPRRHHRPVPDLVVQRPAVEHRALPAPGARGGDRAGAGRPARRAGRTARHAGGSAVQVSRGCCRPGAPPAAGSRAASRSSRPRRRRRSSPRR